MNTKTVPPTGSNNPENLRAEYAALSSYFNTLITFRLTLMGFFLAAIGFMVGGDWPIKAPIAFLGILLTAPLYLFEIRTRILFSDLAKRAIAIEQLYWKCGEDGSNELSYFSRQFPHYLKPYGISINYDPHEAPIKILGFIPIKSKLLSHSFSLDLLYLGILLFFIVAAILSLVSYPNVLTTFVTPKTTPTVFPTQTFAVTSTIVPTQMPSATPIIDLTRTPLVTSTLVP
jgi:hypothetical protein